jgi:hypothetical protein
MTFSLSITCRELDAGDLTKQKEVRTRLKCKDFKWFMETVAFDIVNYYPLIDPKPYATGEVSQKLRLMRQILTGLKSCHLPPN